MLKSTLGIFNNFKMGRHTKLEIPYDDPRLEETYKFTLETPKEGRVFDEGKKGAGVLPGEQALAEKYASHPDPAIATAYRKRLEAVTEEKAPEPLSRSGTYEFEIIHRPGICLHCMWNEEGGQFVLRFPQKSDRSQFDPISLGSDPVKAGELWDKIVNAFGLQSLSPLPGETWEQENIRVDKGITAAYKEAVKIAA